MSPLLYEGKRAVVIGYGITGKAVSEFLIRNGAHVVVYDDDVTGWSSPEPSLVICSVDGFFQQNIERADVVLVSPGVPRAHPVFEFAVEPISELELAYRHTVVPIVAVTGTNGKTTVTTLITDMLVSAGLRAKAVGNIGTSIISLVEDDLDCFVAEASSFQLATISSFRPKVAVWTNFSPDHVDWHRGIDHYLSSKARIFENQGPGDIAVINASDPIVNNIIVPAGVRRIGFGIGDFEFGFDPDLAALTAYGEPYVFISEMVRTLPHDIENALAGSAAAYSIGADLESIADIVRGFSGLAHRVEFAGSIDGVDYYNDSKATTPASVMAAVSGFDSVLLIAGGKNKGIDLSPLLSLVPKLKVLIAIGDSADDLIDIFSGVPELLVIRAVSMEDAVGQAHSLATAGDVVLLSPGCTSFDWYRSYGERGDDFKNIVMTLQSTRGGK